MNSKTGFKQTEIGKIPEDWKLNFFNEVCAQIIDCSHAKKPKFQKESEYIFLEVSNIGEDGFLTLDEVKYVSKGDYLAWTKRLTPKKNDIVITKTGRVGASAIIPKEVKVCIGRNQVILRSDEKVVESHFLWHYLRSKKYKQELRRLTMSGTILESLHVKYVPKIRIPLPELNEQRKIAFFLDAISYKIKLNQQMNKILEAIGQALFKHWFIDFEFPNDEGKPYKSSGGEMVYSEELEKEIPKDWSVVDYSSIVNYTFGFPYNSKLFNENKEGSPIIRIRDLPNNCTTFYTTEDYEEKYVIKAGDLVVGMDGEFRAYIWKGKDVLLNQRIVKISPKYDHIPLSYVYWAMIRPLMYIESFKTGTTVIHLNKKDLDSIKVILPEKKIMYLFGRYCDKILKLQVRNNLQSIFLESIRDTLRPKLMTGKIRVKVTETEATV